MSFHAERPTVCCLTTERAFPGIIILGVGMGFNQLIQTFTSSLLDPVTES